MQHARRRVAAFPGPRQPAARHTVEDRAERYELVDPLGAFVDEHANRGLVAQPGPGAEGVGQVEVGRVLVAGQHRSDTSLSPARRRLLELALCENPDPRPAELGEANRRGQARHPAPDHEDVEPL